MGQTAVIASDAGENGIEVWVPISFRHLGTGAVADVKLSDWCDRSVVDEKEILLTNEVLICQPHCTIEMKFVGLTG